MNKPVLLLAAVAILGLAATLFLIFGSSPTEPDRVAEKSPAPGATHTAAQVSPVKTVAPESAPAETNPAVTETPK